MDFDLVSMPIQKLAQAKRKIAALSQESKHLEIVMCDVSQPEITILALDGRAL